MAPSRTARALVVPSHGDSSVLEVQDREVAPPGVGEVQVEVAAVGANFIDVYQRQGVYPIPTPCAHWLDRDLELAAPRLTSMLALGSIAWDAALASARRLGWEVPRPKPMFGHAAEATLTMADGRPVRLVGSYHVSQQNTFTGKLTAPMLDEAIARLR